MELCNLFRSVFTKRELSKIENLSVFNQSLFRSLPAAWSRILGNDWKSVVLCASGGDEILWRVHSVTHCDKLCSCEIRTSLNIELLLLQTEWPQLVSVICPGCPRKEWWGMSCWLNHGKAAQRSSKDQMEWPMSDFAWSHLGLEPKEYLGLLLTVRYSKTSGLPPPPRSSPEEKLVRKL